MKEYFYKKCTSLDFTDEIQLDSNNNTIVLQDTNLVKTNISLEKELDTKNVKIKVDLGAFSH